MHESYQTTVEKNHVNEAVFRMGGGGLGRYFVAIFLLLGFLSRFFRSSQRLEHRKRVLSARIQRFSASNYKNGLSFSEMTESN